MIEVKIARFIWAHRTVAAGLAAIWNAAFIFVGPVITPPQFGLFLRSGVALIAAIVFAILFVVSLVHDRRKRRRVDGTVSAAR
jgi:membrane protein DedA with SNARE-associated domain